MKFVYATAALQEADFVLIGVADESGNTSPRAGSKRGAESIRRIAYERCVFKRKGTFSSQASPVTISQKIHDYGDVDKKKLAKVIEVLKGKVPLILGGDHSITLEVIKQFPDASIIYFDAHPGVVSSLQGYYGPVSTADVSLGKSVHIGVREQEIQELKNIKKNCLLSISAEEIFERKIEDIWKEIKAKVQGDVYVSIDMNVFDPSIAPGVSAPVPGGLHYYQVLSLVKKIFQEYSVVGVDIMELNPSYDQDFRTTHLATKLLLDIIAHLKKKDFV